MQMPVDIVYSTYFSWKLDICTHMSIHAAVPPHGPLATMTNDAHFIPVMTYMSQGKAESMVVA